MPSAEIENSNCSMRDSLIKYNKQITLNISHLTQAIEDMCPPLSKMYIAANENKLPQLISFVITTDSQFLQGAMNVRRIVDSSRIQGRLTPGTLAQ
jgi:hypothetical protein